MDGESCTNLRGVKGSTVRQVKRPGVGDTLRSARCNAWRATQRMARSAPQGSQAHHQLINTSHSNKLSAISLLLQKVCQPTQDSIPPRYISQTVSLIFSSPSPLLLQAEHLVCFVLGIPNVLNPLKSPPHQ